MFSWEIKKEWLFKIVVIIIIATGFFTTPVNAEMASDADHVQVIDTLRVFNYNIRHGRGWDNDVVDIERIAQVIQLRNPDIVTLQEVDVNVERSGNIDQMEILGELLDMDPVFYKLIPHQGGEFGNGTLTNLEIISTDNHFFTKGGEGVQRGLIQVVVNVNGVHVPVMNTHLCNESEYNRLLSIDQILNVKQNYSGMPIILAGDMNAQPDSDEIANLSQGFTDTWLEKGTGSGYTARPGNPTRRIDYIFYTNNMVEESEPYLRPIMIEVVMNNPLTYASDHLPVYAEYEIVQSRTTSTEQSEFLPDKYALGQNYPNPFNPVTKINFSLPKTTEVAIEVFSLTGRRVATLVNETRPAGNHYVGFDASHLSSGIYIYRMKAGDFMQFRQLTLIK